MCKKIAYYCLGIGMILNTGTYFLNEAQLIPHWLRLGSLIFSIVLILYGITHSKNRIKN